MDKFEKQRAQEGRNLVKMNVVLTKPRSMSWYGSR